MLLASPQLVGYSSELPRPGTYCTKTVMGRSILLTRASDGRVRAFDNICLHRQSRIADGCGAARRLACPYHSWPYDLDGALVGVPGKSPKRVRTTENCPLADELDSWGIGRWAPLGEKLLDCPSTGSSRSTRSRRITTSPRCTRRRSRRSPAATAPSFGVGAGDQRRSSSMIRWTSSRSPGPAAASTSASSQSRYSASDRS
jgi:nitrite reductase/ring-hydroxylating ferredoxin subunit